MANEILRMNYFDGLMLKEDEFITEQNYHIRMRRLHNLYHHKPGIVGEGLKVEKKPGSTNIVIIREGMALNEVFDETNKEKVSQEIININDYSMDFLTEPELKSTKDPKEKLQQGTVYIFASYSGVPEGDLRDHYESTKIVGQERIHLKETAIFQASNSLDVNPTVPFAQKKYILLGKVTINASKNITDEVDTSLCEYSGPRGASMSTASFETKKLTLSVAGATGLFASIEGKSFSLPGESTKYGIRVNSPQTEFSGPLTIFSGNMVIDNGNLIIPNYGANTGMVDGRDVSADGTKLDSHVNITGGNPHGTNATHIDGGTAHNIINRINHADNAGITIIKDRISPSVGSTGWVKLPFLPKKYGRNIVGSDNFPEFEILEGHSKSYLKGHPKGNGIKDGAFGIMEIPIPPYANKISKIRIGGKNVTPNGITTVSLYLNRAIPDSPTVISKTGSFTTGSSTTAQYTDYTLIKTKAISGVNFFETIDAFEAIASSNIIGFPATINPDYDTLTLSVIASKESDIYFVAAYFEVL